MPEIVCPKVLKRKKVSRNMEYEHWQIPAAPEDAIKTLLQKRAEAAESKLSQPTVEVKPMDEAPASDDVQTSDTSSDASEDTPEASADAGTGKAPPSQ